METALEYILMNSYKADMINFLNAHPEQFDEALSLAISDKHPYAWKAAWLLWSSMVDNDPRIQEYIKRIVDIIPEKEDNQKRELMIILNRMELDDEDEGLLFNHCVEIWKATDKKSSVRYHAISLLVKIAERYPDLCNEIKLLTQEPYMNSFSETATKSIFKMISGLPTH